jgi:hypothetical protein
MQEKHARQRDSLRHMDGPDAGSAAQIQTLHGLHIFQRGTEQLVFPRDEEDLVEEIQPLEFRLSKMSAE